MAVYFLRAGDSGPIKIGFTSGRVGYRLQKLKTGCPWPIVIIGSLPGERKHERYVHRVLMKHRMEGDWFAPSAETCEKVEEILSPGFEWPKITSTWRISSDEHEIKRIAVEYTGGPLTSDAILGNMLFRAKQYCELTNTAPTILADIILNGDGGFFRQVECGRNPTFRVYEKVMTWLGDHWPKPQTAIVRRAA